MYRKTVQRFSWKQLFVESRRGVSIHEPFVLEPGRHFPVVRILWLLLPFTAYFLGVAKPTLSQPAANSRLLYSRMRRASMICVTI